VKDWETFAKVYLWHGRYSEAETMLKRALEGRENALGLDRLNTLTAV
jgi:hypothetical protein